MTLCYERRKSVKETDTKEENSEADLTKDLTQAQIVVSALDLAIQVKIQHPSTSAEVPRRTKRSQSLKRSADFSATFLRRSRNRDDKLTGSNSAAISLILSKNKIGEKQK